MLNAKSLKSDIDTISSIELVADVLRDVASMKLKRVRNSIQQNVTFFSEVSTVYRVVKGLAIKEKVYDSYKSVKNNRTLCLLITSNSKFHGNLDSEVIKLFVSNIPKLESNTDYIVIGQTGQTALQFRQLPISIQTLKFVNDYPSLEELKKISDQALRYGKVLVFHTQFETVLKQTPVVSDASFSDVESQTTPQAPIYFVLEPDLKKMISFFESQILILLMQSIFLDVELARLAARMVSMNQASNNALKLLAETKKDSLKIKKQIVNKAIVQTYSGLVNKS